MLSIITPVYNGEKFIKENIESIKALTIPFEHIIIDGASTDNTLKIISEYPHIKLFQQEGKAGMYQAIHQGFERSTTDYICWVNCDDRVVKEGFELMYQTIQSQKLDLVYSDSILHHVNIQIKQKVHGVPFGKFFMKAGYLPFVQPSSIYRKNLYSKVGGLDYQKFRIIGDRELFTRMAQIKEAKIKYLPTVSTIFLKHGDSLGDNNFELYQVELAKAPKNENKVYPLLFKSLTLIRKLNAFFDR